MTTFANWRLLLLVGCRLRKAGEIVAGLKRLHVYQVFSFTLLLKLALATNVGLDRFAVIMRLGGSESVAEALANLSFAYFLACRVYQVFSFTIAVQ